MHPAARRRRAGANCMSDRFELLYEKYSDGTLNAAERQEFLKLLGDKKLRTRLVSHATFEAVVGEELREAGEEAQAESENSQRPIEARRRTRARVTKLPAKSSSW